jgi:hypothetical protein
MCINGKITPNPRSQGVNKKYKYIKLYIYT